MAKTDALKDRLDELFSAIIVPEMVESPPAATAPDSEPEISEDTTVGALPLQDFRVDASVLSMEVDRDFRQHPDLAGVILQEGGRVQGLISRRKFYEHLGKLFGVAIYLNRPVSVMFNDLGAETLTVRAALPIPEAVNLALGRPADDVYEPLLIQFNRETCLILDIYTLLLAQARLLASLRLQVVRDNEELEKRVKARAVELLMVNAHLEKEIAEKRRAEEKLHARLDYEKTLNLCANVLLTGGESHGIIQKTLEHLIAAAGTSRVFVLETGEVEGLGSCLKLRNQMNSPHITPIPPELHILPLHWFGDWLELLWSGQRVIGHSDHLEQREKQLFSQIGVISILLLPIGEPGNWVGVIGFGEADSQREWDENDIQLLHTVAQMLYAYLERRRNALELAQARDEALKASKFKSELLTKVSHELRTPLGAVLGYAQLLRYGSYGVLTGEQQYASDVVISSTKYLASLVNSLLDQAQLENRQLSLQPALFNLRQMATEVETRIRVLAENKGLAFKVGFSPNTPIEFYGDRVRIEQILTNLLGNAVKFTDQGSVQMQFGDTSGGRLAVEISDTGPGIPLEAQARVFEPFIQADGSATRLNSGTGLGLSISKQLVEMMHGQITLKSENGSGCTFSVELPMH